MNIMHRSLLILLMSASLAAQAQIYQYKDEWGNTVYSDTAPADEQVETVSVETPSPANQYSPENSNQDELNTFHNEVYKAQKREEKIATRKARIKRQKQKNITQAKKALAQAKTIRNGDILRNANGGTRKSKQYHNRIKNAERNLEKTITDSKR